MESAELYDEFLAWAQTRGYFGNTINNDVDRMAIMHVAALMRGDTDWVYTQLVKLTVVPNHE